MYYIYKITNSINGKNYIGQTIQSVERRYRCHINSAMSNNADTHLARAIRKYGPSAFSYSVIDTADDESELLKKEQKWIKECNSIKNGYNETDATYKCGGNTYMSKSAQDMKIIIEKLRISKLGGRNPSARPVVRVNILTGECDEFDSILECAKACGINAGKTSLTLRLTGRVTIPFRKKWMFYYSNKEKCAEYSI